MIPESADTAEFLKQDKMYVVGDFTQSGRHLETGSRESPRQGRWTKPLTRGWVPTGSSTPSR